MLTDRETKVLRNASTGQSAKAIAEKLEVSYRTVQNHVENTLQKLQLHNCVQLTRWAVEHGIAEERRFWRPDLIFRVGPPKPFRRGTSPTAR